MARHPDPLALGPGLTRRRLLQAALATGAWSGLGPLACAGAAVTPRGPDAGATGCFRHGVASGDPLADRVVLWTRVTPPLGAPFGLVEVRWRLARDPALADVAASGSVAAGPERDYTVKIDAAGLEPGRRYWYGFEALGERSRVGRTRTLPEAGATHVRLAVLSCSNLSQGFFNAYARVAARDDLDAVLHLGDYIYEYGREVYGSSLVPGRAPEPLHELLSLADYRTRYAQHRRDPDLQALHAAHPMIPVWDDHESANNSFTGGAENHQPASEGPWAARRAAAERAYEEWLPLRPLPDDLVGPRIWRSFRFGELADLVMLDTRLYGRDAQAAPGDVSAFDAPGRSLLGGAQESWLRAQLSASQRAGVAWRLVGQQVVFSPLGAPDGRGVNPDSWDGYRASRGRVLQHLAANDIADVVILSGDVHSSWAFDVAPEPFSRETYDPATGRGSLAVEFVTPAVSSNPAAAVPGAVDRLASVRKTHPHLRFVDLYHRGYLLVDVTRERTRAEWWITPDVTRRTPDERRSAALETRRGASHLVAAS